MLRAKPTLYALILGFLMLASTTASAETQLNHVHLAVGDPPAVAAWYQKVLGGERREFPPGPAVQFTDGLLMTQKTDPGAVKVDKGGRFERFGFSTADVAKRLEAARLQGALIVQTTRVRGGRAVAVFQDPWGGRVELLDDPLRRGFHHVHILVADPAAFQSWLTKQFGGVGRTDTDGHRVVDYSNFSILIAQPGKEAKPSVARTLDHIGLQVSNLQGLTDNLKAAGSTPGAIRPGAAGSKLMFFEGPEGVSFEALQLPESVNPAATQQRAK